MVLLSLPSPEQSKLKHPIPLNELGKFLSELDHQKLVKYISCIKEICKNYSVRKITYYLSSEIISWSLLFWYLPYSVHVELYSNNYFGESYYSQDIIDQILKLTNTSLLCSILNGESIDNQYSLVTRLNNKFNCVLSFNLERFKTRFESFKTFFPEFDWSDLILGTNLVLFLASDNMIDDMIDDSCEYNLKFEIYSKKTKRNIGDHFIYFNKNNSSQFQYNPIQKITLNHYSYSIESGIKVLVDNLEDIVCDLTDFKYEILTLNQTFQKGQIFNQVSFEKFIFDTSKYDKFQIRSKYHTYLFREGKLLEKKLKKTLSKEFIDLSKSKYPTCYMCYKHFNPYLSPTRYVYHCLECGLIENSKRIDKVDLSSLKVYVSGCRIKIGYSTTLRFLRLGSNVIGSTRFPKLAWLNFQKEADYENWKDRLIIFKSDFKSLNDIGLLINYLKTENINVLINNACQTIRPSETYLQTLCKAESSLELEYKAGCEDQELVLRGSEIISYGNISSLNLNIYHDINDPQGKNSTWFKEINELDPVEIVEVTTINQLVPTLLINQLRSTMSLPGFIINVTAVEGQFNINGKDVFHPHTNMAKAALNMMIRTLAEEKNPKIYHYAIDPGFVSGVRERTFKMGITPIQADDGASRIVDPIISWFKYSKLKPGKYRHYKIEKW